MESPNSPPLIFTGSGWLWDKYERQEDITHLLDSLKTIYKISEDWDGKLYCGLNLEWIITRGKCWSQCQTMWPKDSTNFNIPPQSLPNMHPINGRAQTKEQQNNSQLPWILHRQSQRNKSVGSKNYWNFPLLCSCFGLQYATSPQHTSRATIKSN